MLTFYLVGYRAVPDAGVSQAYLVEDGWNDWHNFWTLFELTIFDKHGAKHTPGYVKIAKKGMEPGDPSGRTAPLLPPNFDGLAEEFFSLGQSENYYETLNLLETDEREFVLTSLRDIAFDAQIMADARGEPVYSESLLRNEHEGTVETSYRDRAQGRDPSSLFRLRYRSGNGLDGYSPYEASFEVRPDRDPPTNVHAVIGRNGVGKSYFLQQLARALVAPNSTSATASDQGSSRQFSRVLSVTFSAFDQFEQVQFDGREDQNAEKMTYRYIGLDRRAAELSLKAHRDGVGVDWAEQQPPDEVLFTVYAKECLIGARHARWKTILMQLGTDPMFADSGLVDLLDEHPWKEPASIYRTLSSGHKIVLLTITALVALVEERTLVLIDEPETHLHPPLLSSLIRALSELLKDRNGAAILATHSPVVLQEVPASCVQRLHRFGKKVTCERLEIETFGEGVARLTADVFGHEVTRSGFNSLLDKVAGTSGSFEEALDQLGGNLGAQGRAILRAKMMGK